MSFGQSITSEIREKILNISDMPYICHDFEIGSFGCGDESFWSVVKLKNNAILALIELLDDTTQTKVNFPNYGGQMTVADIALTALAEIIYSLPNPNEFFDIKAIDESWWISNLNWLQRSPDNRKSYKTKIEEWYKSNESNLLWTKGAQFHCGDLNGVRPNDGFYRLTEK